MENIYEENKQLRVKLKCLLFREIRKDLGGGCDTETNLQMLNELKKI